MDLSCLTSLLQKTHEYEDIQRGIRGLSTSENHLFVPDAVKPYLIAALHNSLDLPILVLTSQPESAKKLLDELNVWCPDKELLRYYPENIFPAGVLNEVSSEIILERLQTLSALAFNQSRPIIVCPATAAVSKTSTPSDFKEADYVLEVGSMVDPIQLIRKWQSLGYELEEIVEIPGTASRRGGIVDIYPVNNDLPVRIEFFGNKIDSIRLFETRTQRTLQLVDLVKISPAKENILPDNSSTILDYLSDNSLLILDDSDEISDVILKIDSQVKEDRLTQTQSNGSIAGFIDPLLAWPDFQKKIDSIKRKLIWHSWSVDRTEERYFVKMPFTSIPKYGGKLEMFIKDLVQKHQDNDRILIVSQQTERLYELLDQQEISVQKISDLDQIPALGSITLIHGSIIEGWRLNNSLTVYSDNEIFGFLKQQRRLKQRPVRYHKYDAELSAGDFAVHVDHGIGRFSGLKRITNNGIEREYLVLEYAAGDKLYVPTDHMDSVSRYIGSSDQHPRLTRLGTQEWTQTKQRIKKSVVEMAEELLQIYAARDAITGFAFGSDNLWQCELESSFPYVETPDQLEAVRAVKQDMETTKPMDRLICGDVGYGKTEIALRAAFKAIMDGKQVALLVPTTVLAQQHIITFRERLQAFPINVESLSRFCSEEEQLRILDGLVKGTIDICIGTHRLIQKDVVFKDIGLLIIDEEQRFGVAHKEHFKKMRKEIDVLTLSATPIPRTLHMSLTGIRDLSIMETPPEDRLPINTYVGAYNEKLIREAILRELERNGQVFFVHNRVRNITSIAARINQLVPEAKIAIAHGQMKEEGLEKIMQDFVNSKTDILLTTTIIESGLDIPNVNTLIINESDRLGLTQLYQLRGRIGRGSNIAYAYFLFDKNKSLTSQARKRLRTIYEATELGAGFSIAIKDLEIRGAGNILGAEQSGHIAAIGYDLYCRLLSDSVNELKENRAEEKGTEAIKSEQINIDLPLEYYIPEQYVASTNARITYYKRLTLAGDASQLEDIADELRDRYGVLPEEVNNLLYALRVKQVALKLDIESIFTKDGYVTLRFKYATEFDKLIPCDYRAGLIVGSKQIKLDKKYPGRGWKVLLEDLLKLMADRDYLFNK
jgi:transcription-repair coupling factor (superfamily II helicase)